MAKLFMIDDKEKQKDVHKQERESGWEREIESVKRGVKRKTKVVSPKPIIEPQIPLPLSSLNLIY